MNIVFIIYRSNAYKYFGTLIEEGLSKDYNIECWHCCSNTNDKYKKYLDLSNLDSKLIKLNIKRIKLKYFSSKDELSNLIINSSNKIFFSQHPLSKSKVNCSDKLFECIENKWCVIPSGPDFFQQFTMNDFILNKNYKNFIFFSSNYFLKKGKVFLKNNYIDGYNFLFKKRSKIFNVGSTHIMNVSSKDQKYLEKKNLLYLPFPYDENRYPEKDYIWQAAYSGFDIDFCSYYKKKIGYSLLKSLLYSLLKKFYIYLKIFNNWNKINKFYLRYNEKNIIKILKSFCKKNRLNLVIKPRFKFPVSKTAIKIADKIASDNETFQNPNIFQEEVMNARVVVGSLTMSPLEVIGMGVPFINIQIPHCAFLDLSDKLIFDYKRNSIFNFKGAVYNYTIKDLLNNLNNKSINDFKLLEKKQKKYLNLFCGTDFKKKTAIKIYDILKKYLS